MIEGQAETIGQLGLNGMHFGTIFCHWLARLGRSKLCRGSVFVRGAEKQHLVTPRTLVAGIEIGGQLAADEVAQMLDPVDVGNGGGDEMSSHASASGRSRRPLSASAGGGKVRGDTAGKSEAPNACCRASVALCFAAVQGFLMTFEIRDAISNDTDDIADLWHAGWHDAHAAIVPAELVRLRTHASFVERSARHIGRTRLAVSNGRVSGLCMIRSDELFQLYVAGHARGTGMAQVLIAEAEERIRGNGHSRAWLACAVGNERAARFYQRCGWTLRGPEVEELELLEGSFALEVWRFEKVL